MNCVGIHRSWSSHFLDTFRFLHSLYIWKNCSVYPLLCHLIHTVVCMSWGMLLIGRSSHTANLRFQCVNKCWFIPEGTAIKGAFSRSWHNHGSCKSILSANIFKTLDVILDATNLCNIQQCTLASYWCIHLFTYLAKSLDSLWLKVCILHYCKNVHCSFFLLVCLTWNSLFTRCFYAIELWPASR